MIKLFIKYLKRVIRKFFNKIDYSGKFDVIEVALYLVYFSVKKKKYLSISQLIQLLYLIQEFYLDKKKFALFKEDFLITNKGRLEIKEVNNYFCGFGVMNLFYQYSDLKNDCKISEAYQIELEQLFDSYIDKIKSGEFEDNFKKFSKFFIPSSEEFFVFSKNSILNNKF